MKKLIILLLTILLLSGCAQKNPLLKPNIIDALKNDNFYDDNILFPIKKCGYIYAGYHHYSSKKEKILCDQWRQQELEKMIDNYDLTHVTIIDFSDPKLWQMIYPKDKN